MAGTILYKMALDSTKFKSGLSNARNTLKGTQRDFKRIGGGIAATLGVAFGVQQVFSFGKSLVELSGKAEGVQRAFNQIADQDYLRKLRESTHNTVSDLDLMTRAVQAKNFDIPLKSLGNLFEFAAARAQQTGESVDHLVDSIVLGIGRKSPLILDNLGISAVKLREKLQGVGTQAASVGDIAAVVGSIATEELEKMGGYADTSASKIANISTQWENFKLSLAQNEGFKKAINETLTEWQQFTEVMFSDIATTGEKWRMAIAGDEKASEIFNKVKARQDQKNAIASVTSAYENMYRMARQGANVNGVITDKVKVQITTYGDIKQQIADKTKLLEKADVTNQSYIRTLYAEIEALKKKKEAFEALSTPMAERFAAPSLMQSRGTENVTVSIGEEGSEAMKAAKTNLAGLNNLLRENISLVPDLNRGWTSFLDTMYLIADKRIELDGGLTALQEMTLNFSDSMMGLAKSAQVNFKNLGSTIKETVLANIRAFIAEGVAGAVSKALSSIPFPFNMAAGVTAAAGATALFNTMIPKLSTGAMEIPAGFPNDTYPAFLSSGETVIPAPSPFNAAKFAGIGGGEVVFRIGYDELVGVLQQGKADYNA